MADGKQEQVEKAGKRTSLRIYLEIGDEQQVHDTAERIADLLLELGYNEGDRFDALVACIVDAPDVEAWAEGMEPFVEKLKGAGFILIPTREGDDA
jgi:hypothetical protein